MKEREWKPDVLAAKLRKQDAWERTKRAIVLDSVRTALLEKRMGASRARENGRLGGDSDSGGTQEERSRGTVGAATAAATKLPGRPRSGSSARDA